MATVSQLAAPRNGDALFWSAYGTTPLGLPGAFESFWSAHDTTQLGFQAARESGDSVAFRSPQRRQGLILVCV